MATTTGTTTTTTTNSEISPTNLESTQQPSNNVAITIVAVIAVVLILLLLLIIAGLGVVIFKLKKSTQAHTDPVYDAPGLEMTTTHQTQESPDAMTENSAYNIFS